LKTIVALERRKSPIKLVEYNNPHASSRKLLMGYMTGGA
jgi:hypothetical protein